MLRLRWFRALLAAQGVTLVAVAAALGLLRQQVLDGETRTLAALSRAMALEADRTIGVAAVVLRDTQEELARGLLAPASDATDALLRERVRATPPLRALALFDDQGQRTASSSEGNAPAPLAITGRDFFEAARRARAPAAFLSAPYTPLADGRPAISLSSGWYDAEGRLLGVVALMADPDFLARDFQRIANSDVRLSVFRADGTPLGPADAPAVPAALLQRLAAVPVEQDRAEQVTLGARRLMVTATPLQEVRLVQVVWRDLDAVLAAWTKLLWLAVGFVGAMLALTLSLAVRIAREQARTAGLEQRLARSRQLEALGNLAGGVAHDFNNVLAAVVGFGEVARQDAAEGSRMAHLLDRMLQAAERGRQQVERVLSFSRGQPRRREAFALQPLVAEVLDHLPAAARHGVTLQPVLSAPGALLRGDPTSTYEAVMNLCVNALQAMPDGGTLAVSLDLHDVTGPLQLYDSTLASGRYARLVVRDSGTGMAPEVLAHLFEPFFTTRRAGGGSGLGLAVVHGVVADLGGGIDVQSTRGTGTTFTLLLPVVAQDAADAAGPAIDEVPTGQGEVVLVVDDEPALVELAQELLAGLGYEPRGTTSPADALQALRRDPAAFDLLFTDETMPGMSGTALAQAARALRPDLPVVLASGHGGGPLDARARQAGVQVVLAKPLTRARLAQALRQALQAAARAPG